MSNDKDVFATTAFGKAALRKMGKVPANFRLYSAGWLGKEPKDWTEMLVKGREFRANREGKLNIPVPGTIRSAVVTQDEMRAHRKTPTKASTDRQAAQK